MKARDDVKSEASPFYQYRSILPLLLSFPINWQPGFSSITYNFELSHLLTEQLLSS
jgi:hypothetical protein